MNSKKVVIGIVAALVLLAVVFFSRQPILKQDYNARLDGRIFDVTAKVPGLIKSVDAQNDMFVSRDFPLLEVDNQDARAEYEQASAALIAIGQGTMAPGASMNVSIDEFEARVKAAAGLEAKARQEAERLSVALAEASFERRKIEANPKNYSKDKLADAKLKEQTIQDELDEAKTQQEQASLTRMRAEQDLNSVKEQRRLLSTPQGTQALREVELEAARNRLTAAENKIAGLRAVAPVDGYVLEVFARKGERVEAGDRLFSIVPLDAEHLWLTVFFEENVASRLIIGQECKIVFSSLSGLELSGKVQSIRPATLAYPLPGDEFSASFSTTANLVPVVVSLDNYDPAQMPQLRLGMTALVTPL